MKLSGLGISILFILISLASSLKTTGVMSYYALFTDDFVERFCENKERPELKCDGKCALSKMLLEESNGDKTPIHLDWIQNETLLFVHSLSTFKFFQLQTNNLPSMQKVVFYSFDFFQRITHPPRL